MKYNIDGIVIDSPQALSPEDLKAIAPVAKKLTEATGSKNVKLSDEFLMGLKEVAFMSSLKNLSPIEKANRIRSRSLAELAKKEAVLREMLQAKRSWVDEECGSVIFSAIAFVYAEVQREKLK